MKVKNEEFPIIRVHAHTGTDYYVMISKINAIREADYTSRYTVIHLEGGERLEVRESAREIEVMINRGNCNGNAD